MAYHILSWNVLFREHELHYKPNSEILKAYPLETDRVQGILEYLRQHIQPHTVVCLQEVSLELAMYLQHFAHQTNRSVYTYNVSKTEQILTITPSGFELVYAGNPLGSRGCLAVRNKDLCVVNCHLTPERFCHVCPLEFIQKLEVDPAFPLVVAGDFNAEYRFLRKSLEATQFYAPYFPKTYKNKAIDQMVLSPTISVLAKDHYPRVNLSDHRMIGLLLQIQQPALSAAPHPVTDLYPISKKLKPCYLSGMV